MISMIGIPGMMGGMGMGGGGGGSGPGSTTSSSSNGEVESPKYGSVSGNEGMPVGMGTPGGMVGGVGMFQVKYEHSISEYDLLLDVKEEVGVGVGMGGMLSMSPSVGPPPPPPVGGQQVIL